MLVKYRQSLLPLVPVRPDIHMYKERRYNVSEGGELERELRMPSLRQGYAGLRWAEMV